jgi:IS30 family transposase
MINGTGEIMQRVRRPRMSMAEKGELWARWKKGESLSEIGRALGRIPGAVYHVLAARGGVPPVPRQRSRLALTTGEREEISRAIASDWSLREIAKHLARAPSTVSREVHRHGGRRQYRAAAADEQAWRQARRPKRCHLATYPVLRRLVAKKLAADWSPQQIAGWLRATHPDNPSMRVSHETIYLSLFVQSRGVLKRELLAHLRRRRTMRRSRYASTVGQGRGRIVDAVSIRDRPAEIEDRAVPGHWEGDLLTGAANSHVATLVERQSRFLMLVRVTGKDTTTVVRAITRTVRALPRGLMASLTWDRGTELAAHKTFTVATKVRVYFCDPHSPWQRGSNENTNGLLRQYFPEGTDLSTYSQAALNAVAQRLNMRPRKTLGYETPADRLATTVAMTA